MMGQKTEEQQIVLTVVFDNIAHNPDLKTEWGYGCVIQTEEDTLLFDTGNNGTILLDNMAKLKIEPQSIHSVVISHTHWDHLGGLSDFLQINSNVTIYIPNSSSSAVVKKIAASGAQVIRVDSSLRIVLDIFSLGELKGLMPEQSIVLRTSKGLVIITGCAHPGIVNIIKHAKLLFPDESIYLTMGGFHLRSYNLEEIEHIVKTIQKLGVQQIAPSHCTGETAIEIFKQRFQENFIQSGVGRRIVIGEALPQTHE